MGTIILIRKSHILPRKTHTLLLYLILCRRCLLLYVYMCNFDFPSFHVLLDICFNPLFCMGDVMDW